jgi:hypothetical protein
MMHPRPAVTEQDDKALDGIRSELDRLVDEYRSRCLWFLRSDYYPRTLAEILRTLGQIESNGDRAAFQRVAEIRAWLSRSSNGSSAAS